MSACYKIQFGFYGDRWRIFYLGDGFAELLFAGLFAGVDDDDAAAPGAMGWIFKHLARNAMCA